MKSRLSLLAGITAICLLSGTHSVLSAPDDGAVQLLAEDVLRMAYDGDANREPSSALLFAQGDEPAEPLSPFQEFQEKALEVEEAVEKFDDEIADETDFGKTTAGELMEEAEVEIDEFEEVGEIDEFAIDEYEEVEILEEPELTETELIELDTERELGPGIEFEPDEEAQDLISITLDEVPLPDVIRMFTRISGANIVAGTNLIGTVTVSLQDVEWEPALQVILDSVDLALIEKSPNIYSVMSKNDLAAEPVTVETVFLDFTTVSNVLPIVQRMLISTNASAAGFSSANAIIVQETAKRLQDIKRTIDDIDKPRAQVYIETKFVELNEQAIKDIGIDWQVLQGYTVRASGLQATYDKTKTKTEDTTETFDYTDTTTFNEFDTRRGNSIGGSVSGAGDNRSTAGVVPFPPTTTFGDFEGAIGVSGDNVLGFDFEEGTIDPLFTREFEKTSGRLISDAFGNTAGSVFDNATVRTLGATLTAQEFALTLSALKQNDGTGIVSNPKLIVASGETADIHVGRNEPNVVAVPQGDSGDRFAYRLDGEQPFIEIGVKLSVTPTVNTAENITVRIQPELSRLLGEKTVGEANTSFPITQIRRITTEFNLESGHTVAIGGLTETTDKEFINKVPLLGDIPIIGKFFFRHTHTEKIQDEIIIFVTVGLANPEQLVEASGIPSEGRLIHRHLAKKALQAQGAE